MPIEAELDAILHRAFPGCRVSDVQALSGGSSARAQRAEVVLSNGLTEHVVVRRPYADSHTAALSVVERESAVLTLTAQFGVPVPRPRHLDRTSAAIVLDHVPGAPDFAPRDRSHMLRQMATELARIHRVPVTREVTPLRRRLDHLQTTLEDAPAVLDESLNEGQLRALLVERFPWPSCNAEVLLHGDYWPGNLVWQSGTLAAVLDWEEASIGDPLADVALARLDLLWAFDEDAMLEFTGCYREQVEHTAEINLDPRTLALWDLAIALRPMSKLATWATAYVAPPICRPDIDEDAMRQGHLRFVARALAAL